MNINRFPDKARVCFIGDSITHNNLFLAHIVTYYRNHFSNAKVEFYNCGISGGTITTTLNSFDEDVRLHNPTHAVIMIGINDSNREVLNGSQNEKYFALNKAYEQYKKNLHILCNRLEDMGVEIILCTQMPYAEYMHSDEPVLKGGCALLLGYAKYVDSFAKERGYPLCDYHSYITKIMQEKTVYKPDRVHPNDLGHYYMAKCFLDFQGIDIGDETELASDVAEWHKVIEDVRNTIATEHFILEDDFTTTDEQRRTAIVNYLENEQTGPNVEYFKYLCDLYLDLKPQQAKNIKFTIDFMKNQ